MPCSGLIKKLSCCGLSSGHWWCWWGWLVGLFSEATEMLHQFLLIKDSVWPSFKVWEPLGMGRCLEVGFPLPFLFTPPFIWHSWVSSPSCCVECSPGWQLCTFNWLGFLQETVSGKQWRKSWFLSWLQGSKAVEQSWLRIHFMLWWSRSTRHPSF